MQASTITLANEVGKLAREALAQARTAGTPAQEAELVAILVSVRARLRKASALPETGADDLAAVAAKRAQKTSRARVAADADAFALVATGTAA